MKSKNLIILSLLYVTLTFNDGTSIEGDRAILNGAGTHYRIETCSEYKGSACVRRGTPFIIPAKDVSRVTGKSSMQTNDTVGECFINAAKKGK